MTTGNNNALVNLSEVFSAIRKASDTGDKLTGTLILGLYEHEVTFSSDVLEHYFKTEAKKRREVQTSILSQNDDDFAAEIAFIKSEGDKDKNKRDLETLEIVNRRHKSLRNIFHSCMEAVYFLRMGGNLDNNMIGPITGLTMPKGKSKFTLRYRDTDGENVKLSTPYSSAMLIRAGQKVVDVLLNKARNSGTAKASASTPNASPSAIVGASLNGFNTMIDAALVEVTNALKSAGSGIDKATVDDMPGEVSKSIDTTLAKLLTLKFAHDGMIDAVDVLDWITDNVHTAKLADAKKRKVA